MISWSNEIKELEILYESVKGKFTELEKELNQLKTTEDPIVVMLYSRRSLEIIVTDLCESELKRPRKTEPLKGIIDKLNSEEIVPLYIITSMHGLNGLSTFGAHPKDFDPEQVKPALNNLAIILKWYLNYKGAGKSGISDDGGLKPEYAGAHVIKKESGKARKTVKLRSFLILIVIAAACITVVFFVLKQTANYSNLEKSIAVLPFRNDSPEDSAQYFLDGVMDELINKLQTVKELRVISRTSVEPYRGQSKKIPDIAKELKVNYIIEASGQKAGNSFRMRVQLIRAKKERHIWGDNFEQKILTLNEYFKIQARFVEDIARELNAAITPEEKQIIEKRPTTDIVAWEAYFMGISYSRKLNGKDLDMALQFFELAKNRDPNFALAYSGISSVWARRQQMGILSYAEASPHSLANISRALELDSTNSDIQRSLAGIRTWTRWDWKGGEASFRKAIELNPGNAEAHSSYSHLLIILGRPDEAMKHIETALALDPLNPQTWAFYGVNLMFVRRYDESVTAFQKALEINPTQGVADANIILSLYFAGRENEAFKREKSRWRNNSEYVKALDNGYAEAGFRGAYKKLANLRAGQIKTVYSNPYAIAIQYSLAEDTENAMIWLLRAYEEHNPNVPYLLSPIWDKIRNDPRFQDLARNMNLQVTDINFVSAEFK